ncbi:MAG: HEPN domain-containing protein [Thermodesulfovibrionales bacterium]|nr:HEPN domain-containing protein [Thermodesulfovibrionales bacterium]MDP3049596.1 HEPN domain-containing protein [Thermodesulfovibrionales bacterium]
MTSADKKQTLILYRLESAREKLKACIDLLENADYKDSVSRSYYAIFTAARALLATKQLDSSKHSGVIALFNQHFVKPGIIHKEMSKLIEKAKLYREQADYGDFFVVSKDEAEAQIQSAKRFIAEVEHVIKNMNLS